MLGLLLLTILATLFTTARPMAAAGVVNITLQSIGFDQTIDNSSASKSEVQNIFNLNEVGTLIKDYLFSLFRLQDGIEDAVPYFIFVLVVLSFLASIVKYSASVLNALIRSKVMGSLRSDIALSLIDLGMSFFDNKKSGELISRIVTDSHNVGMGVVSVFHRISHSALLLIIYFIFLLSTSLTLTIGVCGIVALHYVVTTFIKNPIKDREIKNIDSIASLSASLQEIFSNIRLIKTYSGSKYVTDELQKNISDSSKAYFQTQLFSSLEVETRYLLDGLAEGMILFIAITQLFSGAISMEGFVLYIYVARLMLGPVNEFSSYMVWLQRIIASSYRIEHYSSLEPEIKEGSEDKISFKKIIKINDLSFSYANKNVLNDINFSINKNEKVAIVGPSGSGKSTLLDIILRFYDPQSGSVKIDGENIKSFNTEVYRGLFGVVSQDVLLLNETIFNNIDYGRGFSHDEIHEAASIANADNFIRSLENGYQTLIGDRGVKLSGGQKQRLSIARAILADPSILILDEATSSLDAESEKKVQNGIHEALKSRTAIIVAHRLSTIINSDKIIVLNEGRIELIGSHEELSSSSPTYRELYFGN